jgi:predicted O-methyltransferase YrrM
VIRDRRRQRLGARVVRALGKTSTYSFTSDYVTHVAAHWTKYLAPFSGKPDVHFLEIGSFEGRSAVWMFENVLTDPTSTLTCVDPFWDPATEVRFDHNLRIGGCETRVRKLKGRSEQLLPHLAGAQFQTVYVDGSHHALNVLMDAVASWRLLVEGGLLIFDDYEWEPQRAPEERPQLAIDLFLTTCRHEVELLHKGYQVIVRKRRL